MFTFETTDLKEVRRFRIAQFNGRTATVRSGGSTVTGHVRSVLESKSSIPLRWVITIVPSAHGSVTTLDTIDCPDSTLMPRQAVIAASVSASAPNPTLSCRFGAARITIAA